MTSETENALRQLSDALADLRESQKHLQAAADLCIVRGQSLAAKIQETYDLDAQEQEKTL